MRVISGKARGTHLLCLDSDVVRPTTDRVKENIFNIIQFNVKDANVLDLFSGSGAMGIEAISRGAKKATFYEIDKRVFEVIKKNIEKTRSNDHAVLINKSFEDVAKSKEVFDLVFLDPPYHKNYIDKSLLILEQNNLLSYEAILVLECDFDEDLKIPNNFIVNKRVTYGRVVITILNYKREAN